MDGTFLLGIDIGTSQSKGVLTDFRGNIAAFAAVDHNTEPVRAGWYEHDAEEVWVRDCKRLIQELKERSGVSPEQIASVGISAIGPCVLPVDRQGSPLCRAILYGIDTRASEEIDTLNAQYGEDLFVQRGGNTLSSQAAGPKILWLKNHRPEVFREAACFMTASSYLVYRLTGRAVMDYYTAGAGYTPLFHYHNMAWDSEMCEAIGCAGRLPELGWSAEQAGRITRRAAEEFGLKEGTCVCIGTCDAAAEAVSVGVITPGQTMLMLGSTAFLISVLDKPATDKRLWAAPYLFPDTFCLLGGMGSAGSLTKWFLKELSGETVREAEAQGVNPYGLLAQKAEQISPGSEGLLALPYFCGERTPLNDPEAKGVIFGLDLHHTQAHLYRALLEGVAFGIRDNLEVMTQNGCPPQVLNTVGGGALNTLWTEIISDVTGYEQAINQVVLGAAFGDAFLAGLCCGEIREQNAIREWTHIERWVRPDAGRHSFYSGMFPVFQELYHALYGIMHHGKKEKEIMY